MTSSSVARKLSSHWTTGNKTLEHVVFVHETTEGDDFIETSTCYRESICFRRILWNFFDLVIFTNI